MTRRFGLAVTLALSLGTIGQASSGFASPSAPAASRIVDRTVVCQMPGIGSPDPIRFMTFSALSEDPPIMFASNGPDFELRVSVTTGPTGRQSTGSVALNRRDCTDTSLRVPLSATGLRGGPSINAPGKSFTCNVPTRVLMRVKARFKRPTAFSRDRETPFVIRARGRITTGSLAITSLQGKPLAFASVNGATGKAQIFVAPSRCTRTT